LRKFGINSRVIVEFTTEGSYGITSNGKDMGQKKIHGNPRNTYPMHQTSLLTSIIITWMHPGLDEGEVS
jgi:hypothetical protein